jgi:hypothetical protein
MTTASEHPLEALHRGRDAVQVAASEQARLRAPSLDELHAYGSAIVSTLAELGNLSTVLADQVAGYDKEKVQLAATGDNPAQELHVAAMNMVELREALELALKSANRYWHAMEHVDRHTAPGATESGTTQPARGD